MFDWIPQGLDLITTRVLGVHFTVSNMIVLGVFFVFGFWFGKLTKDIKFWKILILLTLGGQVLIILLNSHSALVSFFIMGIIANHIERIGRVLLWASDLKDLLFAFQYRRAFEDIRRKEQELEERERAFREEQARFYRQHQQGESEQQKRWREQARNRGHTEQAKSKRTEKSRAKQKTHTGQKARAKPHANRTKKPSYSPHDRYLIIMGLEAGRTYNQEELKRAFRKQAQKVHPDKGGSHEAFLKLMEAYEGVKSEI